jgi:RNA polymerase sigma factor for flagellar operon FliA
MPETRWPAGDDDVAELWRALKKRGCPHARERLILHYVPLVTFVAARLRTKMPASVEIDDLWSDGVVGLIDAVERFDLSHKVKFETYATTRVRGAMLDQLRALDWVPRSVRAKARELERATSKLQAQFRREPTRAELAREMGVDVATVQRRLHATAKTSVVALDELLTVSVEDGEYVSIGDTIADEGNEEPGAALEAAETADEVRAAMGTLSEREHEMISLYYFDGATLSTIGSQFGVTESRVSQIHSRALRTLRECEVGGRKTPKQAAVDELSEARGERRAGRARTPARVVRKSA